ncbi:uncharacterized protein LOC143339697 [Chaetodon auriga]|uniref:uncharacterized protein LOC143339697 n=1 Tax=Chaetodon auriga TaxID=39042 RepID=UPI0040329157
MWASLSASCWTCLLALMLFAASQVDSMILGLPCCRGGRSKEIQDVQQCFEQKPRSDCSYHAFVIITSSNKKVCVKGTSPWLKKRLSKGEINCPPELLIDGRFVVLDEDDVE